MMICGCQRKCDEWQTWLPICVMLYVIKQGCQYVCAACCFLGDWLFTVRPALTIPASCCEWVEKPRRLDHICARWQAQSSCMFVIFFIHTVCTFLLSETSKTEVVLMFLMWRGGCWAIICGGATLVINMFMRHCWLCWVCWVCWVWQTSVVVCMHHARLRPVCTRHPATRRMAPAHCGSGVAARCHGQLTGDAADAL